MLQSFGGDYQLLNNGANSGCLLTVELFNCCCCYQAHRTVRSSNFQPVIEFIALNSRESPELVLGFQVTSRRLGVYSPLARPALGWRS